MYYVIICIDKPGQLETRMANRPDHVAYVGGFRDQLLIAGPFLDDDGETMVGSMLIMEFASQADAETFAAGDPYNKAGVFESVTIRPWKKTLPAD